LKMGLEKVQHFQQSMFYPVLWAMIRGVRIDLARRAELIKEVHNEISRRQDFLKEVLGHELNPGSSKQMSTLFYSDFKMPTQMTRAKKGAPPRPTLDDDALQKLVRIEPLLRPIINACSDIRTLGIFLSNFLERELDLDNRMRCSFNIGGSESGKSSPKTYRLSSSQSAFGTGANLQVIPSEKSKSLGKAAARGGISMLGDPYQFPNLREIFIPDPG
jgi:DNA polymerase I-like protein with 3'-5' exonuclease and polymerase domains